MNQAKKPPASGPISGTDLSPAERKRLEQDGWLVFPGLMSPADLVRLREAFEEIVGTGRAATERKQTGTRHAPDLPVEHPVFHEIAGHARMLAAAHHVVNRPLGVLHLGCRDPLPGFGQQGLHTDWMPRRPGEPSHAATALWLLDDFTAENGATRLVPGSHLLHTPLAKSMQEPASRHPDECLVTAPAGAVVLFNGHLWHSGTRNRSHLPRRVFQCQYVARDVMPPGQTRWSEPDSL